MPGEPLQWERQAGEDEEAWGAFQRYRDQTPPRRVIHAAAKRTELLSRWYNEHAWRERVAAYDVHLDAIRRETREAVLKEDEKSRAARQLGQLKMVQDILDRELAKLWKESTEAVPFGTIKVGELNKLMANAITLERLIRGESTENHAAVSVELDKLTPDELRQLRALRAKMGGEPEDESKE